MHNQYPMTVYVTNSIDAYIPELWAYESLAVLEDNIVMGSLVHRDFENQIQKFGDVVNTRKPASFTAKRKLVTDSVTDQNATATNVPVPLDQHVHVSFVIKDAEMSKSFKDLAAEFIVPAMIAQAKFIDQICLGQMGQFYPNAVGKLGGMTSTTSSDYIVDARTKLNILKAPDMDRHFIWTPTSEGLALKNDLFVSADKAGDLGAAQREAFLGRKFGFNNFASQLAGEVTAAAATTVTGAVNMAAGAAVGATAITVDGFSAAIANGSWVSIAGDIHRVVSTTGGSTPTVITIDSPGMRFLAADDAVVTVVTPGAVNLGAGYAAGWQKEIVVDGFTKAPTPGQLVSFGTSTTSAVYTVVEGSTTSLLLDRPLSAAIADDAAVNVSPVGYYNFAMQKNAIALVVRPLAAPPAGTGARSMVVEHKNLAMRCTIAYDSSAQGLRVTLDMLCGVAVLDSSLATLVLG